MEVSISRLQDVLRQVAQALRSRGIPHALAGGMAVAAHGLPRATKDLDFLADARDAEAIGEVLAELGFGGRRIRPVRTGSTAGIARHRRLGRPALRPARHRAAHIGASATRSDPSRGRDRDDVLGLLRLHGARIDRSWISTEAAALGVAYAQAWDGMVGETDNESVCKRIPPPY